MCDYQAGLIGISFTSPTKIKSMKVSLCRLTTALKKDNCQNKTIRPGIDQRSGALR